jgi:DNA repair protein RecN (Recombination protein N)
MLAELHVAELGVIEDLTVVLGPGMTVLTGETGAGKTLIVDAISLLLGGRAEASLVRPGAGEAVVEGRFVNTTDVEVVLTRVVPASGRARAYIDGRMASAPQLAELGGRLVDLHGQHAHQSLLHLAAQRAALDVAGDICTEGIAQARRRVRDLTSRQAGLGGDARTRARELDLLRYQVGELDAAGLGSPTEDNELQTTEEVLSHASALRTAAGSVAEALASDEGIVDQLGALVATLAGPEPLRLLHDRLLALQAELSDAASEARAAAEAFEDNPDLLAQVGARRRVLTDLRRKYGDSLEEVIIFRDQARARIAELEDHDLQGATLERDLAVAQAELEAAEAAVGAARRAAAPALAAEVESALQRLAMPRARFAIDIGPDRSGDGVTWLLGANPGEPLLPLAKVASGGELARAMLAVRLVLTGRRHPAAESAPTGDGGGGRGSPGGRGRRTNGDDNADDASPTDDPPTLVFDEVDAGIGGEAAVAVGQALAALGRDHQVLVVTHLPQVAAFGDRHLVVRKHTVGERTIATTVEVDGATRVVELSRMLSGRPDSPTARRHAEELLAQRAP